MLRGGMAEWIKAAVLKTAERKLRRFESYSHRHAESGGGVRKAGPSLVVQVRFVRL